VPENDEVQFCISTEEMYLRIALHNAANAISLKVKRFFFYLPLRTTNIRRMLESQTQLNTNWTTLRDID